MVLNRPHKIPTPVLIGVFVLIAISAILPPPMKYIFGPAVIIGLLVLFVIGLYLWGLAKKLFAPIKSENTFFKGKPVLDGLSIKAVLISTLVNLFFVILFVVFVSIVVSFHFMHNGHLDREGYENAMYDTPLISIAFIGTIVAATIFAGYIAAYIAVKKEILNGAMSQILIFLFGIYELIFGPLYQSHNNLHVISSSVDNILLFAGPFLGVLGGYIRQRQILKKPLN